MITRRQVLVSLLIAMVCSILLLQYSGTVQRSSYNATQPTYPDAITGGVSYGWPFVFRYEHSGGFTGSSESFQTKETIYNFIIYFIVTLGLCAVLLSLYNFDKKRYE